MSRDNAMVAPGGDGFVVGRGRVCQARKVPVRMLLLALAVVAMIVSAVAMAVAWVGGCAPTQAPGGVVGVVQGAAAVAAISATVAALALLALGVERFAPHEVWGLLLSRKGRRHLTAARRFAIWWPRKAGQLVDAIRADNGRWFRPSCETLVLDPSGALVAVLILPRALHGADVAGYMERCLRIGPDVLGFRSLELVRVKPGYWSTKAFVRVVYSEAGGTVRNARGT